MTPQEPLLVWEYIGHLPRSRIHCEGEKAHYIREVFQTKWKFKWNFPLSVGPLRILKNKNREDANLGAGKAIALVADLPSLVKNLSGGFSFATRKVRGWFKTR